MCKYYRIFQSRILTQTKGLIFGKKVEVLLPAEILNSVGEALLIGRGLSLQLNDAVLSH